MRTLALPAWRKPSLLVRRQACQRPNPHVNAGKPLGLVGFAALLTEPNSDVPPPVRSPDPIGFTLMDAGIRHWTQTGHKRPTAFRLALWLFY